jgi:hypothetical protein
VFNGCSSFSVYIASDGMISKEHRIRKGTKEPDMAQFKDSSRISLERLSKTTKISVRIARLKAEALFK